MNSVPWYGRHTDTQTHRHRHTRKPVLIHPTLCHSSLPSRSDTRVCRIWDIKSKRLIHSSAATYVTCMTMNDEYLIMGSKDGEIQVIDFMTGQVVASTGSFPGETVRHFAFCSIDDLCHKEIHSKGYEADSFTPIPLWKHSCKTFTFRITR